MNSQLISICGSGRSGTHLIGRVLSSHPKVDGRIEDPKFFKLSSKIATTQDYTSNLVNNWRKNRLFSRYNRELEKSESKYLLDKSHPNLWIAEELLANLHSTLFVGIKRDVRQTVASMKNHLGVQQWYKQLPQDKSNRFLGIDSENVSFFSELSMLEKYVYRVVSHHRELDRLNSLMENFYLIDYNDLMLDYDTTISKLSEFLNLENVFAPESFNSDSIEKWKSEFTREELRIIEDTLSRLNFGE